MTRNRKSCSCWCSNFKRAAKLWLQWRQPIGLQFCLSRLGRESSTSTITSTILGGGIADGRVSQLRIGERRLWALFRFAYPQSSSSSSSSSSSIGDRRPRWSARMEERREGRSKQAAASSFRKIFLFRSLQGARGKGKLGEHDGARRSEEESDSRL
jgi:hypothetical protein